MLELYLHIIPNRSETLNNTFFCFFRCGLNPLLIIMNKYNSHFTLKQQFILFPPLSHTHTHINAEVCGVVLYSRASGVVGRFCRSSHSFRKAIAVSLSSFSSVAVISIFSLENSLMASPSTIVQVLSLISTGNE